MTNSEMERSESRLLNIADAIVVNNLKLDVFVNQIADRLSKDIKEIDDHLLDKFGPIGKGVSGREMSLLFISELLPISNAVIRIGAERKYVEETLGQIEEQLQKVESDKAHSYKLHTMSINVLTVAVLLYLLRACHRYVKNNKKDDKDLLEQWEKIRARTSTRLEEALKSFNSLSKIS